MIEAEGTKKNAPVMIRLALEHGLCYKLSPDDEIYPSSQLRVFERQSQRRARWIRVHGAQTSASAALVGRVLRRHAALASPGAARVAARVVVDRDGGRCVVARVAPPARRAVVRGRGRGVVCAVALVA